MTTQIQSNADDSEILVNGQPALKFNKHGLVTTPISVRQTVELGTVDANGFSAFGGSTGLSTVTTATTLYLNAANGMFNLRGAITNPSWTGLSTDGTMYLYLDIAADGTCTTGSGTLAPVYQWGGTYSTTNGQFTFNIQEMTGKVGNGATAAQTYRVYVGEVVVSGGVVASIVWYQLNREYDSGYTATLPGTSTQTTKNHNLGVKPKTTLLTLLCTTADGSYSVGDELTELVTLDGTNVVSISVRATALSMSFSCAPTVAFRALNSAGTTVFNLTAANWSYKLSAKGW